MSQTNHNPFWLPSPSRQTGTKLVQLFLFFFLTAFYVVTNPSWYGDGVWYALDLKNFDLAPDAGHLLWRPLTFLIWLPFSSILDPLLFLQVISALFAAGSVVALLALANTLSLGRGFCVGLLVLFSTCHFQLLYSGSGSSYSAALLFVLLSFNSALRAREAQSVTVLLSAIYLSLGWMFWAPVSLLAAGPIMIILINGIDTTKKRLFALAYLGLIFTLLPISISLFVYHLFVSPEIAHSYLDWLGSSAHGIPAQFSPTNTMRAVLGLYQSMVALPELGQTIKSLLLGNFAEISFGAGDLFRFALFLSLIALSVALIIQLVLLWSKFTAKQRVFIFGVFCALLPLFAFGMLWQGSDIERFSPVVPLLMLSVALIVERFFQDQKPNFILMLIFASMLPIYHLFILLGPYHQQRTVFIHDLGNLLPEDESSNVLLVTTGQAIGPHLWGPLHYYYPVRIHSILYDVQINGVNDWDLRLRAELRQALSSSERIVVSTPLINPTDPTALRLDPEYPVPTLRDIREVTSDWESGDQFRVSRFEFSEIHHRGLAITP